MYSNSVLSFSFEHPVNQEVLLSQLTMLLCTCLCPDFINRVQPRITFPKGIMCETHSVTVNEEKDFLCNFH